MEKKCLCGVHGSKSRLVGEEKVIRVKLLLDTFFQKFTANRKQGDGPVVGGRDTVATFV